MTSWLKKTIIAFVITLVLVLIRWIWRPLFIGCYFDVPSCPNWLIRFSSAFLEIFIPVFIVVLILVFLISWIIKKVGK